MVLSCTFGAWHPIELAGIQHSGRNQSFEGIRFYNWLFWDCTRKNSWSQVYQFDSASFFSPLFTSSYPLFQLCSHCDCFVLLSVLNKKLPNWVPIIFRNRFLSEFAEPIFSWLVDFLLVREKFRSNNLEHKWKNLNKSSSKDHVHLPLLANELFLVLVFVFGQAATFKLASACW